jgi:L-malate glycosyltransferase
MGTTPPAPPRGVSPTIDLRAPTANLRQGVLHQLLPVFRRRDAIGDHAVEIRQTLRAAGIESEIYSPDIHAEAADIGRSPDRALWTGSAPILYHASTSSTLAAALGHASAPYLIDYHNITPERFFAGWEPIIAGSLHQARVELADLAAGCVGSMADSTYNALELSELGYPEPVVVPVLVDVAGRVGGVDAGVVDRVRGGAGSVWLFVGRLAPNKCQHDVVRAFAVYRRLVDRSARLVLVGGSSSDRYFQALVGLVEELGLGHSVVLAGSVPDGELGSYYAAADVFVCASEHEGFCVPLLEAMFHRVPVVAFGAAAVPETAGGAGLVLGDKSPVVVAEAVSRVVSDGELRSRLVAAGEARVEELSIERGRARLLDAVAPLVDAS